MTSLASPCLALAAALLLACAQSPPTKGPGAWANFGGQSTAAVAPPTALPGATPSPAPLALHDTAIRDLACPTVDVVKTLDRRFANGVAARVVVEGCGKRGLYVEDCSEDMEHCEYLLVSLIAIPTVAPTIPTSP